jgi:predicted AAA+ superfamily ATPase
MNDRKISLLIGSRQTGKTTLLKALHDEVIKQSSKALFLDLDVFSNYERINTLEKCINALKINGYDEKQKRLFYVFLDEFQRYPGFSLLMKNVYDNFNNIKLYASGSSSLKIKNEIQESLAGRKIINIVYPLDFEEFIWFKEDKEALEHLKNIPKIKGTLDAPTLAGYLHEFLVYGGYPGVVLERNKIEALASIFDLFIKKDLADFLRMEKIMSIKKLIEYLAINNGRKIKYNEISQSCSLTYKETLDFIEILKETYIVVEQRPFYKNKNMELVKIPKIYFIDNGVRNYFINNFNSPNKRDDAGFLFEGYVISELLKAGAKSDSIKFWQDKNKHEVDVVLDFISHQTAIEIKFKHTLKREDFIGLKSFFDFYSAKGYIVNLDIQQKEGNIQLVAPYNLPALMQK